MGLLNSVEDDKDMIAIPQIILPEISLNSSPFARCHHHQYAASCCSSYRMAVVQLRTREDADGKCIGFPLSRRRRLLKRTRKNSGSFFCVAAASSESLYDILGVPPTATERDIKQAYRKLALRYHPDVNKAPDAQQKFMSIKNAYQTLVDTKARSKYDSSRQFASSNDGFRWGTSTNKNGEDEEFYGIEEFLRDLQADFQDRAASDQPKSLWEELAEIGEEFVDFLEKELNIVDETNQSKWEKDYEYGFESKRDQMSNGNDSSKQSEPERSKVEKEINEIEDMLLKLKEELGL